MEHARRAGYPVPEVRDASGPDLVLRRVAGRTMADDGLRRPWRLGAHARTLGLLHRRLHAIPPPPGLRSTPVAGDAFLHLDLHPQNVLVGDGGPWVIDWANAARGPAALDVALTFVIVGAVPRARSPFERFAGALRARFAVEFLGAADTAGVRDALPDAIAHRLADANVTVEERRAVLALRSRLPER